MLQSKRVSHKSGRQTAVLAQRHFFFNQATNKKPFKIHKMILLVLVISLLLPMSVLAAAPVFTDNGPFSITENSSTGTFVGQVVATGATSYAITAGNGTGDAFSIDNSGIIRVLDGTQLDYETTPQFSLTVEATNIDGTTPTTVIINVQNVNDPPHMDQGFYEFSINENLPNTSLVGTVSATDNDPGDVVVYSLIPGPVTAFAIDSDDGEIRIVDTSQIDFEVGPTMYTIYVLASDGGLSDIAPVVITINDANDPPVAVDDGPYNAIEDTPLNISNVANGVLANDTDQDQDPVDTLSAVLDTQAANGTVNLNTDGTFTYTPNPQFDGSDSFTYHANDGTDDSNIATVTINVVGTNDDPTANNDTGSTDEDSVLNVPADGVLGNDTDPENDSLTVSGYDSTSTMGASVTVNADGSYSYDPTGSATIQALDAGDTDTDTFTYTISDGEGGSDTATVSIDLDGVNDAPVAVDDSDSTDEDTPLNVGAPGVLSNDSDIDGDDSPNVSDYDATSANGAAVSVNANGSFSYDPTGSATLQALKPGDPAILDTFTYEISDGFLTDTATMTVTVTAVNDDPTAIDDTFTVAEDSSNNSLTVLSNDSSTPETGETLEVTAVGATNNGGTATNSTPNITYTPALNFSGTEVFTYTISDGNGGSDTATVTVTVTAVNDPPVITESDPATVNMSEDSNPNPFSLTLNATDPDIGDTLTWSIQTQASNGIATASGTGTSKAIGYTPNSNYNGTDSFVVQVSDGNGGTDTITVNVNISAQNDLPDAVDDSYTVNENTTDNNLTVLGNDTTPDAGETLTIFDVGTPDNSGTANNNTTNILYSPAPGFVGTEVFTYTITDGNNRYDTATVTITVQDVNEAPVIDQTSPIGVTIDEDGSPTAFSPLALSATDGDGDPMTWSIFDQGNIGIASVSGTNPNPSITINYAPTANMNGADSFVVRVSDGRGGTDDITVNVTINPQNDNPDAVDDNLSVNEQSNNNTLTPLSNDTIYPDSGETLTITAVGTPDNGGSVFNNGSDLTYTPLSTFIGTEVFTYTISDGNGGSDTATISVSVDDVNFAPTITEGASTSVTMSEDGSPTAFSLTLNATDPDGNTLTWSIQSQASNGTASASGTGTSKAINYTPTANYNGNDSFVVQVSDGFGGTDTITVNVTIDPVNDDPVAVDDTASTPPETAVVINVLNNDSDVENDTLTVTAVTQGSKGSVTHNGTTVTYTPNANESGNDTFTYTISDGNGGTDTATVTVQLGNYEIFLPMIVNNFVSAPDLVVTNINASSDLIEVTIENQGSQATNTGFWVDFYIDPNPVPTHENELWADVSDEGIVWGVTISIPAGDSLTLSYSTAPGATNLYYSADDSNYGGNLPVGTPVYAQVDSAHLNTSYGGVLETHEILGETYNNVSSEYTAVATATSVASAVPAASFSGAQPLDLPLR